MARRRTVITLHSTRSANKVFGYENTFVMARWH
jgi:hypothetical protein